MRLRLSVGRSWNMRPQIRISGAAILWLALLLLILPLPWIVAAIVAAAFHEICHILAIRLCGGSIHDLKIGQRGASMGVAALCPWQELVCALAGPLGSFLLILTADLFPRLAVCALFHGVYNLLPIYPMDGGRALHCILTMLLGQRRAGTVGVWIKRILCVMLLIAGIYAFVVLQIGILPLVMAGFVICKANMRKMPCKDRVLAVQ